MGSSYLWRSSSMLCRSPPAPRHLALIPKTLWPSMAHASPRGCLRAPAGAPRWAIDQHTNITVTGRMWKCVLLSDIEGEIRSGYDCFCWSKVTIKSPMKSLGVDCLPSVGAFGSFPHRFSSKSWFDMIVFMLNVLKFIADHLSLLEAGKMHNVCDKSAWWSSSKSVS